MPLLAPLFLLGLAAVVVPLLVHLVQREKRDPTAFPSLMFLEKTPAPFSARRHVRDPWLFLLRALAIALLALAFARPVMGRRTDVGGVDRRRRDVVLLLDRSFSMRVGDRWSRARMAVDSVIRTLGAGDRMTLVPFDRVAQAVTAATGDAGALRAALDTITLTDESTRLVPAIAIAQQRFAVSDAPRRMLVVVSDFQRSAWDVADESGVPRGTEIATVDVSGGVPVADRSLRSVEMRTAGGVAAPQVVVSARIAGAGPAAAGVGVRLEVAGRVIERRTVNLPRDGGASVAFAPVPLPPAPVAARVVLDADALPGDDAFHFLLQQSPALRALVVESRPGPFLTRALSIGDSPRFELRTRTPGGVTRADLAASQLVILADGAMPTGIGAAALVRHVTAGGGLLVALGDETVVRAWQGEAEALIPGTVQRISDRAGSGSAALGLLDERHPALASLAGESADGLGGARFDRYRAIDTTGGVLVRFDDGAAAITEHTVGAGRVITVGSTLDGNWNDLPRQPAFLPLVRELSRHAAAWREPAQSLQIGSSVRPGDLDGARATDMDRWVATAPSGRRTTIGGSDAPATLDLAEAGVHELRPGGAPGSRPLLVAANIAPAELDLVSFDPLRLTAALTGRPDSAASSTRDLLQETQADREARQSTWWYLLLAVALLLAAESVVARRAGATASLAE